MVAGEVNPWRGREIGAEIVWNPAVQVFQRGCIGRFLVAISCTLGKLSVNF